MRLTVLTLNSGWISEGGGLSVSKVGVSSFGLAFSVFHWIIMEFCTLVLYA